jgi:hypothetical protein
MPDGLGVDMSLRATRSHPPPGELHSTLHCVVGDVKYPNGESGILLYLKASITGDEPDGVLEYKARQPAFPHHSTMSDQFFDESQFESYRKQGVHIAQAASDHSVRHRSHRSAPDRSGEDRVDRRATESRPRRLSRVDSERRLACALVVQAPGTVTPLACASSERPHAN